MRIVCPYTVVSPETREALRPHPVDFVYMEDDQAYFRLLAHLWEAAEDVVIVEHDIVPWHGSLDEMIACPEQWCAFSYTLLEIVHSGLGCCKFAGSLMRAHPSLVADTLSEDSQVHPRGHWCNLDDRIRRQCHERRITQHVHGPSVGHTKPDRTGHGCIEAGWFGP